jgi:hypothetical protein
MGRLRERHSNSCVFRAFQLLFGIGLAAATAGCNAGIHSSAQRALAPRPTKTSVEGGSLVEATPPLLRARDVRVTAWLEELAKQATEDDLHPPDPSDDLWAYAHATTPDFCRRITEYDEPFESCRLYPAALGTAGVLAVVHDCGAHLCDVKYWVFARDELTWVSEKTYGGLDLEVSPDHSLLLIGQLVPTSDLPDGEMPPIGPSGPMWTYELVTEFIDIATRRSVFDIPCGSMVLSPGGRYYVCRDTAGHVLRIPATSPQNTAPERVVTIELPEDETIKLGGSFQDYPGAVRFPTEATLEYDLFLSSGDMITRTASWSE